MNVRGPDAGDDILYSGSTSFWAFPGKFVNRKDCVSPANAGNKYSPKIDGGFNGTKDSLSLSLLLSLSLSLSLSLPLSTGQSEAERTLPPHAHLRVLAGF